MADNRVKAIRKGMNLELDGVERLSPGDVVTLSEYGRMRYLGAPVGAPYRRDTEVFVGREEDPQGGQLIRGIGFRCQCLRVNENGEIFSESSPHIDKSYSPDEPAFILLNSALDEVKIFPRED